jgi:hypothetical protein
VFITAGPITKLFAGGGRRRVEDFYADSGFFDGKNRVFWRIGSKPFLWRILKTGEKARFRNVIEPLCISHVKKVKREILSFWFSTKSDSRPVQRMSMDVWGLRGERMEWLCP